MALVRTTLAISAALAAPTLVLQQPLKSGPGPASGADAPSYAVQRLSPLAVAGYGLFRKHCSACHGAEGEGGERGPSLVEADVNGIKLDRMTFHLAVREGRAGPEGGPGPMPAFDLTFNQIELIGRYIREVSGNVDG